MCGIAGYCGPESRFSDERLGAMLRAIEHRGPDDCGVFQAPVAKREGVRVWMGSRRLAIRDLSPAGHQPMVHPDAGTAIAFNGELYNFHELKAKMEAGGQRFRSRCDTEAALRSWTERGPAALEDWRGMFGAAVWDPRAEELWLVRDHWGIKPLYYRFDGEGIGFCSEVRGLLAGGLAPRRLSRRGIEEYLRFGAVSDPVTMIDGVYALPPGHALRWSGGRIEIRQWAGWQAAGRAGDEPVESMLREIVRQQLIADVPVAVFLSGGVDSSVVALLARQAAGPEVETLSVVFEESRFSEGGYARRVAERIGTRHREVLLRGEEAPQTALEAIGRMDQPTIDGINTYVVSGAARRAGFPVALSGLGGDEFFGGYATFRRDRWVRRVQQWAQRAPALAQPAGRLARVAGLGEGVQKMGQYLAGGDYWEHPYFLQRTVFFPRQIERLCRGGERSAEADRMAAGRRQSVLEEAAVLDPLNQVSLLEARCYMANMLLRDSDQMSMAHSLELRVPLVDHLLAGRLLAVSGREKGFGRGRKLWLREAFAKALPSEVFDRPKMGFTLPFALWLKGPLCREVERTLARNAGGLWSPEAAARVWKDFWDGRVGWSRPWALYVLSRWAEKCVYGETENIS